MARLGRAPVLGKPITAVQQVAGSALSGISGNQPTPRVIIGARGKNTGILSFFLQPNPTTQISIFRGNDGQQKNYCEAR
jgi:hypothetical protein